MRIARANIDGSGRYVVTEGDRARLLPKSISERDLVQTPASELAQAADSNGASVSLSGLELLSPIAKPSKIICVGLNYRDHAIESGQEFPPHPLLFAKFPSSLAAPGAGVSWVDGLTECVDWEAELAVVIGTAAKGVAEADALQHVFGYTIANDVSARDLQFGDGQWVRGKSLDTFCPLGPVVVTPDEFDPASGARISTRVNGQIMQDSTTDQLIFDVPQLVSWISGQISLEPGDLILTGTPGGVGGFREEPIFLRAGDVVQVSIDGIGELESPVIGGLR